MSSFSLHGQQFNLEDKYNEESLFNYNFEFGASSYIADLRKEKVASSIRNSFDKAKLCTGNEIFSEDDCAWLYSYAFKSCLTVRHNPNGTIFIAGNFGPIINKYKDKLEQILPSCTESPVVYGNYFITPNQYGLHNDSTRIDDWERSFKNIPPDDIRRKYVPWRNIIIPLWIAGPTNAISHGIWFDQRYVDFAHVFFNKDDRDIATTYPVVRDHSKVNFHLRNGKAQDKSANTKSFDQKIHEKFLYYTPIERLEGLSTELIAPWIPGVPIVFDAFQLHATNSGTNLIPNLESMENIKESKSSPRRQWTNKMGLLLCFLREI